MSQRRRLRTIGEVRREFNDSGVSVSAWARANNFSVPLVYGVLSGKRPGTRGQSHNIAVALGLKAGRIADVSELPFRAHRGTDPVPRQSLVDHARSKR